MGTLKYKLLILHGWSYSTEKWKPFLDILEEKGVDYELLKIPGLTAPIKGAWTLSNYVDWLDEKIQKIKTPVVLLGHSNGGRISLAYSTRYPEKISKLVLIDSAGIYHNEFPLQMKRLIFGGLSKLKKISSASIFRNALYKVAQESDYNKATPEMKKTMANLLTSDMDMVLSKVKVPTLILWGSDDKTTPITDGKLMNRQIENSVFKVINGARHSPQFTNVEETSEQVLNFLKD